MTVVNFGLFTMVFFALATNALPSRPMFDSIENGETIIARFPNKIFDVQSSSCSISDIRNAVQACQSLNFKDLTNEEKFACSIVAGPDTSNKVLLGLYPTDLPLDTFPGLISNAALGTMFDKCALPNMIRDGCVVYTEMESDGQFVTSQYHDKTEYIKNLETEFNIDIGGNATFRGLTFAAIFNSTTRETSQKSVTKETAGLLRSWQQNVGVISIEQCDLQKYLDNDFFESWKYFTKPVAPKGLYEMLIDPKFKSLMQRGFYFPVKFAYGIEYKTQVLASYDGSFATNKKTVENIFQIGADLGIISSSTSITSEMINIAKKNNIDIKFKAAEYKSGKCDFSKMLSSKAAHWREVLTECATEMREQIENLDHPSYIPKGGMVSLKLFLQKLGLNMDSERLSGLMQVHFGYCTLEKSNLNTVCYLANGEKIYSRPFIRYSQQAVWKLVDDFSFANDSQLRDAVFNKACGGACNT